MCETGTVISEGITFAGGNNVEPKQVTVRKATKRDKQLHGINVHEVIDCPGCSEVVPVISNKIYTEIKSVAVHPKDSPNDGEVDCAYGGERIWKQSVPSPV